jgi:hypothetical protein
MNVVYKDNIITLNFSIINNNLFITKLLNLNLFNIFYQVNKNVIDVFDIVAQNTNKIYVLIKHLFKDLGFLQKYLHLNVIHDEQNHKFILTTLKEPNDLIINTASDTSIDNKELFDTTIIIHYFLINEHAANISVSVSNIYFKEEYIQKIVSKIIIKLFNNLKLFIDNYLPNNDIPLLEEK